MWTPTLAPVEVDTLDPIVKKVNSMSNKTWSVVWEARIKDREK